MGSLVGRDVADLARLRRTLDEPTRSAGSLQEAAQRFVDGLYEAVGDDVALVRLFATVPYESLPRADREFAARLATARGVAAELGGSTTTISLLGTRGRLSSWNDRSASRNRLSVPLLSASFVKTIPMVSRLMSDGGTAVPWIENQTTNIVVASVGQMARLLHVEDAAAATTQQGHPIVPDQAFVRTHGVRSVVGVGGRYLNRVFVVLIFFATSPVDRDGAQRVVPFIHSFKTATMRLAMEGRFFAKTGS